MTHLARALLLILGCLIAQPAQPHALEPGYLELSALGQAQWRVLWRVPDVSGRPMAIAPRLPETCTPRAPGPLQPDGRAWSTAWIAHCPGGLAGGALVIEGLEATATDTLVRYGHVAGAPRTHRLTADAPGFTIPADPGWTEILRSYTGLGIVHILEGTDHLLFVFALVLLIGSRRRLVATITAFTLAHSLTLAAAVLGWLRVPAPPVEAVIALSIVFLALEIAKPPEQRDPVTERAPWVISFGFGLIHGLGFAGALREIDLPEGDIPLALFSFNIGVEIGQLLFIVAVLTAMALLRRLIPAAIHHARTASVAASYGIGTMAAFWTLERLSGF